MGRIAVGMDLGTSTSLVSVCMPDGQPRLLRDRQGIGIIPSVVSIDADSRVIVGQRAKDRLVLDPANTFFSTKRFIGRDMREEKNQWAATQYSYQIVAGENGIPMVKAHGRTYSLIDVAAMILGYLKEVAEEAAGLPVPQAVITVPANFNDIQRSSTRQAGEKAGFEVLRIINEPTAAALAYGFGREKDERVAIYDFGGGTFDMTILEMRGAVYEVLATAGDTMLGGDDFDRRILDDMVRTFQEEHGRDPHANPAFMQRLHLGAERMKCQLSDWVVAGFTEQAVEIGGKTADFRYDLSRERFNEICADLIEMSFNVCDETLRLAGCTLTSIDQIILVGGTTRVPLVRERVTRYFLRPPLDKIQPDIVVSHGAAIQAFALAGGAAMWPAPEGLDEYDRQQAEARGVAMAIQGAGAAAGAPVPAAATSGGPGVLEITDEDILQDVDLPAPALKAPSPWDDVGAGAAAGVAADLPAPSRKQPATWEAIDVVADLPAPTSPTAWDSAGIELDLSAPSRPAPDALDVAVAAVPRAATRQAAFAASPPIALEEPATVVVSRAIALGEAPGVPPDVAAPSRPPPAAAPRDSLVLPVRPPPRVAPRPPPVTRAAAAGPLDALPSPSPAESGPPPQASPGPLAALPLVHEAAAALRAGAGAAPSAAPLLLDVTPLTLGIQTVGGNVEALIRRNTTVPVEQTRAFTTSQDDQTSVRIRVCQGESRKVAENVVLSEVSLDDLPPGPRGSVKINVTFEIDTDGILNVSAVDTLTGKAQRVRVTLFGG